MEKTILEKKGFELKNFDEGTFYVYEMDEEAIIKKIVSLPKIKNNNDFFFDEFSCILFMIEDNLEKGRLWNIDTDDVTLLNHKECEKILELL